MYKRLGFFVSLLIVFAGGFLGWYFSRSQNTFAADYWQPHKGQSLTWQWQLTTPIDTTLNVDMYDIDLFDVPTSTITELKNAGKIVICYFSAGTIEYDSSRPDQSDLESITPSVIGNALQDWPDENWLDITNTEVRNVMAARLDTAVSKGCDGVEPDNVNAWEEDGNGDGYTTGFNITEAQQIDYNRWLATQAHARNLSVGLKNDLGLDTASTAHLEQLVDYFDWALNEQCYEYGECDVYNVFDDANKAVFGVEYSGNTNSFCPDANARGRYWMKKRYSLNKWRKACETSETISKIPIYRFWSKKNQSHFYTASEAEKNLVISKYDDYVWKYEGVAYNAVASNTQNATPIYRFWSKKNQSHFYTASEAEKNLVINKYDDNVWHYEGVAYYAYPTPQPNTKPVYRFWSKKNQSHFYTASEAEKDLIINKYDDYVWHYEGVAWHVIQ